MKFSFENLLDNSNYFWQQELIYIQEECSFFMRNIIKVDFELIINKISLSVSNYYVVNVSGFCGLSKSMISNYQVPEYKKGILKVQDNMEEGFAYGINNLNHDYKIFINTETGWVCIGNPDKNGNAIEFINNCVFVLDEKNEFISLWLKPRKLPNYLL